MKRRHFLKNTISTALLGIGGVSAFQFYQQSRLVPPHNDNFEYQFLTQDDRMLLEIIVPVFASGLGLSRGASLLTIIQNIESTILRVSLKSQFELRELFDLLGTGFGRLMFANVWLNWQSASSDSVEEFISNWRDSRLELLKIAYRGLHKLIVGSVYGEPSNWQDIGYSGPPNIGIIQQTGELDQ
ncbi:MAG: hypothetical protein L3J46_04960 [Kangiellaceae bacterium]|nr:hypothetical protein [Kangiellaceae bacterium]